MSTDRSLQQQGKQAETTAASTGGQFGNEANRAASSLIPTLNQDINNPTGYTPTQSNNMLVAGEQGAGGANAGVTGEAGLNAVRTHNTGALSGVLDAAAQRRGQTLSTNALDVQNKSADLAQEKRASALKQMGGLYGTDVSAQLRAMGLQPEDINAQVNAGKSGWEQQLPGQLLGGVAGRMLGI